MSGSQWVLPADVIVTELIPHTDERGVFTEIWRDEWPTGMTSVQWNILRSDPRVLRGMSVHIRHDDYLVGVEGRTLVGLLDLREESPTFNLRATAELSGNEALTIPPGVAHALYSMDQTVVVQAVSRSFDPADELGCFFDDPEIGLVWPGTPLINERDAKLQSLAELRREFNRQRYGGAG